MNLRYGDPPSPDECKDLGDLMVPTTLELSMDAEVQMREIGITDLLGSDLTPWARARVAVRKLEQKRGKHKVFVKDLGPVVVGPEGWEVL